MKLYIIRHAETEYNRKGIIQGSEVDSDINDIGDSQSKSFYDYYQNVNFDKIYTSDRSIFFDNEIIFNSLVALKYFTLLSLHSS